MLCVRLSDLGHGLESRGKTCSRLFAASEANPLGPLRYPRPLKPRLDTVLGVDAEVEWFRATRTALSANRANCDASVRVLGALSMTRFRDTSLLSPLTNCLIKMCSSIAGSAALGYARWPISLMSRAKDSILSPASWRRRSSRSLNSSEVSVIAKLIFSLAFASSKFVVDLRPRCLVTSKHSMSRSKGS